MQTAQLHSDMSAFKAANPRAVFADFLRWCVSLLPSSVHCGCSLDSTPFRFPRYSPRDFISDQLEDYEPDRIERDGSCAAAGETRPLGNDVPEGAGAKPLTFKPQIGHIC
jgi:hypothetical protein